MLRGENVKDEEGYRAVFAEQGALASQMAAAKFLDTISKLLGLAGEASDAVSAYSGQDDRGSQNVTIAERRKS